MNVATAVGFPARRTGSSDRWSEWRTQGLATGAELTPFEKTSLTVGGAFLALWLLTLVLAIIVLVLAATG